MRQNTNRRLLCITLALCALLAFPNVGAVAIGVNRASINFQDVLRNGFARETVTITTDSLEPVYAEVLLYGDEKTWLNFSARNFTFSRDSPYQLVVEVRPPLDTRIDTYRVNMSILTGELARSSGGLIGTTTRASLGVPIFVTLTGTQRLACQASSLTILDTERGQDLQVRASVQNTGNVRVVPTIKVEVYDKLQTGVIRTLEAPFGSEILPTVTMSTQPLITHDLQPDQYWAVVTVPPCDGSNLVTFDVLEAGGIKDDGELLRIDAQVWSEVGDIIPITAVFRNNGIRSLRASFRGTISRIDDESVVKVIQTDEVIVDPGVTADLETFFNPNEPGQYRVAGKVFYNQKLTIERDAIMNVNGASMRIGGLRINTVLILAMMLVVVVLLVLIIRRRRKKPQWSPWQGR